MQSVFDSCISGTWPIPSEALAACLIRVCFAEKRLLESKHAYMQKIIFVNMVSRLMLHRLCNRCTLAEDAMIRDLLNECPDIPEHSESGSSLAILSSMGQLRSDDGSGFVSTSTELSKHIQSTHSCTKELGNDISLSQNSLLQCRYLERYQVGSVFELFQ
jgi:hypothetical protein